MSTSTAPAKPAGCKSARYENTLSRGLQSPLQQLHKLQAQHPAPNEPTPPQSSTLAPHSQPQIPSPALAASLHLPNPKPPSPPDRTFPTLPRYNSRWKWGV
jgi:hypothetical protein